ncbi:DUF2332 domain-containing protein [Actinoplanes sp. NPDC051851]|uniref:DUF2332 domain-containing protein n=1 Tax=Actinoplanes sp. NPDC051851 TaxID=3154753 RepID=UPI00343DE612
MSDRSDYLEFARREARGVSAAYERLATTVAGDDGLLALIGGLPAAKRQPNLLFGVVRLLGGPLDDAGFREFVLERWDEIAAQMRVRATQTNEIGRCAALLPVLAALPQPLALIDVGASAGLNLFPDRYTYDYGGRNVGDSGPVVACAATGLPVPRRLPEVVWRAGVDLNPLDVTDPDHVAWLDALIWPEHEHRRERLRAAIAIAQTDPPRLVRGDALEAVAKLAARAPEGATPVVFHTSVVYQMPDPGAFTRMMRTLPVHWISVESPALVPLPGMPAPPSDDYYNVLALDGRPLAWVTGHGQRVDWFGPLPSGDALEPR